MKTNSFFYCLMLLTVFAGTLYPQQGPPPADPNSLQMVEIEGYVVPPLSLNY